MSFETLHRYRVGARAGAARIISDSIGEPAPARRSRCPLYVLGVLRMQEPAARGAAGGAGAEVDEPEQARADGELAWPVAHVCIHNSVVHLTTCHPPHNFTHHAADTAGSPSPRTRAHVLLRVLMRDLRVVPGPRASNVCAAFRVRECRVRG